MTSLQRSFSPSSLTFIGPATLWRAVAFLLGITGLITARSCGYDFGAVARYFTYVALYVALPGAVAMAFVNRGPLSLTRMFALGLPTGFALEIFTFLGLSAIGAKPLYTWMPLAWAALAVQLRLRRGEWPVHVRLSAHHAGPALWLALAFLGTALMAASQMFSEAPLAQGLPTRAIFHDWVYLVSRAAVIKNNWPLDDPSLSGTPLQYHYFMMVHAAASSLTVKIEITTVLLRLIFVPLGAAMVAQAYVLGRAVARSPWGGVIAALLTVMVSEASFEPSYGDPMFLGLFVRWLFVSPTFFFGMVFCGALLIAVAQCARAGRCEVRHCLWLLMLGAAGTGAKGTLLPVILCALGFWAVWRWIRERRLPTQVILVGTVLTIGFAIVYVPTMLSWRTGDAALRPFHVFQLTGFWKEHLAGWTQWFAQWLPHSVAVVVASLACGAVVFAGTCGARLLAIPYLFWGDVRQRDPLLVSWIGAFFIAAVSMGLLLELNSYGELYVILMIRLPMAVLTGGFVVSAARRIVAWWNEKPAAGTTGSASPFATRTVAPMALAKRRSFAAYWLPRVFVGGGVAVFLFALTLQSALWWTRNQNGFAEWLKTPADLKPDGYMQELREGLLWVRQHTEPNAVLVANAFTPENMKKDHWGALDRTLMGVHFYYSALSERRLWFEGPNYIMDTTRARLRANIAARFFYRGGVLSPTAVSPAGPAYVLIDRSLADGAKVSLPACHRVFANARIEIYKLTEIAAD